MRCAMKFNCPHCGKAVDVSAEVLEARHGVLVCPQCLSEIKIDGYEAGRHEPVGAPTDEMRFCPECGKKLPASGLKFCPYCGTGLDLSGRTGKPQASAATQKPKPAAGRKPQKLAASAGENADVKLGVKAGYMRSYTYAQPSADTTKGRTHKEIVVRRWCYVAILALVAIFCVIMYAASRS